jgi:hypothetical protein
MPTAFRFAFCWLALALFINTADAAILTYYLNNVTFSDGGTATGSFNFDPDAGTPCSTGASPCGVFSNVYITTTAGSTLPGNNYQFVCGNGMNDATLVPPPFQWSAGGTTPPPIGVPVPYPGFYVPTCTGESPDSTGVLVLSANPIVAGTTEGFALFFTGVGAVPPAGLSFDFNTYSGTIDISDNSLADGAGLEDACVDAVCSAPAPPTRTTFNPPNLSGSTIASSETLLQYFFFGS